MDMSLSQTLGEIRPYVSFNETCRIPFLRQSLRFLEGTRILKMRFECDFSWWGQRHSCCNHGKYRRGSLWNSEWIKDKAYSYLNELKRCSVGKTKFVIK